MKFKEEYRAYIAELSKEMFSDAPFQEILKNTNESHRKRRFVAMYLIQDKDIFHYYYEKRNELELVEIFDQIICTLLFETDNNIFKRQVVEELGIYEGMKSNLPCNDYDIKEMTKDINLFYLSVNKKDFAKMLKDEDSNKE